MTGPALRASRGAVALACCLAAASCGARPAAGSGLPAAGALPPLASAGSAAVSGSSWTVVDMGGSAARHNNFWQLFTRPAAGGQWRQVTPSGVADNGGLVVASTGGQGLLTGFRPSQDLSFSPLTVSTDSGAHWSPSGLVSPGLADLPDALAAGPGQRVLALAGRGSADLRTSPSSAWTRLTTVAALAATPAGRSCGLTGLSGAAFSQSGAMLLAGDCSHRGVAGIFTAAGGSWHAAGPAVPARLAGQRVAVLRLAPAAGGLTALLRIGSGAATSLLAAFSPASSGGWMLSPPLPVGRAQLRATTVGPRSSVAVVLTTAAAFTLASPAASWQQLPALPAWTAALALGPSGAADAIAAHASTFTDWQLHAGTGPGTWQRAQTVHVTIPYGTSS